MATCNDERLGELLESADDLAAHPALAAHLDVCPRCRARLLELAGGESWLNDASDALRQSADAPRRRDDSFENDEVDEKSARAAGDDTQRRASTALADDDAHERPQLRSSVISVVDRSLADDVPAACEPLSLDFLDPPHHPETLGRLGRYEVESVIGAGGMGIVLKGFDTELHRPVALKVLAPHLATSGAARSRFARESQAAAAIVHDHVLPIHNVESSGKLPYLVMPLVAGPSLQTRIDAHGPLPVKDIVRIALQTSLGLAAAHAQGIIHRDVKPANILLETGVDRVLITDFGLARAADDASVTRSGIIAGTPQYMSPEQTRGEPIDHRSDLFSLGSVMYSMATGRPPFRADSTMGVLRRISDTPPRPVREVNADVPVWLEWIIDRLLEKSPEDRFQSASDAADLLAGCLAHLNQPTKTPLPAKLLTVVRSANARRRKVRRQPVWIASALLGTIALAGLCVAWVNPGGKGMRPTGTTSGEVDRPLDESEPVGGQTVDGPRAMNNDPGDAVRTHGSSAMNADLSALNELRVIPSTLDDESIDVEFSELERLMTELESGATMSLSPYELYVPTTDAPPNGGESSGAGVRDFPLRGSIDLEPVQPVTAGSDPAETVSPDNRADETAAPNDNESARSQLVPLPNGDER